MTPLPRDFREFSRLLNEKNAEYLEKNKRAAGRHKDLADLDNLP